MAEFVRLRKCPFFADQLANMPKTAATLKQNFCLTDNTNCARHLVAIQNLPMPSDLFPNEIDRATKIIQDALRSRAASSGMF